MASAEPINNRLFVLILQHPQEKREALATAASTCALLSRAQLLVGLSWPNLSRALGRPVDPKRWAVLYLGPARPAALGVEQEVLALDRRGKPREDQGAMLHGLEGVVVLDGTWKEAKTLWWRNPWLLKLRRLVLNPHHKSRYGRIRREPRREALSTLEAVALLVEAPRRRARDRGCTTGCSRPPDRRGAADHSARRGAGQQVNQDRRGTRHIERLHMPATGDFHDVVAEREHRCIKPGFLVAEDQRNGSVTGRV